MLSDYLDWISGIALTAFTVAILAWFGDYRRAKRRDVDAVGFMPWTTIFLFAIVIGCIAGGLTARNWLLG